MVLAAAVAGFFLASKLGPSGPNQPLSSATSAHEGLAITSPLGREAHKEIARFIRATLPDRFLPIKVELRGVAAGKEKNGPEYAGGWEADGKFINILFVSDAKSKKTAYLRIWTLGPSSALNTSLAEDLARKLFTPEMLENSGPVSCKTAAGPSGPGIICDNMRIVKNGEKQGVLLRSLTIDTGEQKTVVSACLVPKESILFEDASFCF